MRSVAVVASLFLTPLFAQQPVWRTNFDEAKATAQKEDKAILAAFVGSDWCGYSIKLKAEVFSTPEFAKLASRVVLLEVDFPKQKELSAELAEQNRQLAKQYGVEGHAKALVLDAGGKQIGTPVDYTKGGAAGWIKGIEGRLSEAAKPAAKGGAAAEGGAWMTDYEAALAKAKKEKKLILADFTGSDWCGWCIKLKDEVFSKPEFVEWAADNVVLLELDFPRKTKLDEKLAKQNDKLAQEFNVEGYPTILFIDAKGKAVGRSGYLAGGPEAWIAAAEKEAGIKSKKKKKAKGA